MEKQIQFISRTFYVLSDKTRLNIMFALLDDSLCDCCCSNCAECVHRCCMIEKCVNDIALAINAEQSLVSHQLKVLKKHDLVAVRKEKNKCFYSLKDGHIKQLLKIALEHIEERNYE